MSLDEFQDGSAEGLDGFLDEEFGDEPSQEDGMDPVVKGVASMVSAQQILVSALLVESDLDEYLIEALIAGAYSHVRENSSSELAAAFAEDIRTNMDAYETVKEILDDVQQTLDQDE